MYCVNLSLAWVDTIGIIEAAEEVDSLSLHMCFLWITHQIILQAICMRFHRWALCSASVWPWMVILSAIPIHPWHSLRIWSIFFWKMSWEQMRPKGSHRKWYLPNGLLNVVSRLESWLRTIDQYPWWASQLGEEVRVCKLMSDFLHSGHLVMIAVDGLTEVMGIQAQA